MSTTNHKQRGARINAATATCVLLCCTLALCGCHLIFPFEGRAVDAGPTDAAQLDVVTTDISSSDTGPDSGPTLSSVCPFGADKDTTGLFNFVVTSPPAGFSNLVTGGTGGYLVNLAGYTITGTNAPENCGGGGLQTPSPAHVGTCSYCNDSKPLACSQAGYAVIPSWSGTKLDKGSIDLWVWFDSLKSEDQAIISRDAMYNIQGGHLAIYRHGAGGFIAVRLQGASSDNPLVCSKYVDKQTWYHVGVNFGSPGLELYVDGELVAVKQVIGGDTCSEGKGVNTGLGGNDEPWVVGGGSWFSCPESAEPVTHMMDGIVANLRISSVRRDFAKLYTKP